jgi:putative endonuclease
VPHPNHTLGQRGEEAVVRWLVASGWRVLARRWRCGAGELDVVLRDPTGALVGVEVKLRRSRRSGSAVESVDQRRVARLRAALVEYARGPEGARGQAALRTDLVTVEPAGGGRWRLSRLPGIDAW